MGLTLIRKDESATFVLKLNLLKIYIMKWISVFLIPSFLMGQLYDSKIVPENAIHYFGLGYFPTSWQTNLFMNDAYASNELKQRIEFNTLSNALRMNYVGTDKMLEQFKTDYPNSNETSSIDFDVANYYFNNEKYRYALKWFTRVSENQVPKLDIPEYNFNKGYTLFSAKRFKQAKSYLEKVKNNKTFESDAHYYLGHIAYQLEDFDEAEAQFSNISNPSQKENLSYFQADMNFRLGRFEQAIEFGKLFLSKASKDQISEISKIIGESYFNLEAYKDAILYLETYNGKKGTWENIDFYQLGYAHYMQQNYEKAIGQFNKIIENKNALAQNAYYYLADCYLKTNQKSAAQNAFKSASKMNFDSVIKEDASLNYAKLSYDIGNPYEESPKVLLEFLETFPKNEQAELIGELLINSYTKSGNYAAALQILEDKSGYKNNETLQRVLILKAVEDFKIGLYSQSSEFFQKAIKIKENKTLGAFGLYWLGRSEYERSRFNNSLDIFKKFKKHPERVNIKDNARLSYDMGYIYFKLREYTHALQYFSEFNLVNDSFNRSFQRDTFLRMGDCQFALKQYWPALEYYNTAIALNPQRGSYAMFQKAMSYGFVDRNSKKIETLIALVQTYSRDPLLDDSIFELASSYSREGNSDQSLASYDLLLSKYKNSPYIPRAILNKGLILYNKEQYGEAKGVLEDLVIKYRLDPVAQQAVRTLREIAVDQSEVNAFTKWVKEKRLNTFTDIELETTAFTSAEKQFLDGNTNTAERLLKEYIEIYPKGTFGNPAQFYLAEIYFEKESFIKAFPFYKFIVDQQISSFTEKSLVRIVTLLKKEERLSDAIDYLEKLDQIASFEENKRFAKLNLMQAYYAKNEFEKTLEASNSVLEIENLGTSLEWDATLLKARSALVLKDSLMASEAYEQLEQVSQKEYAAEALFYKAEYLLNKKKYKTSITIIEKIAGGRGQSGIWNAKALLLLAKNYYALEDSFQAIFVLESVSENFKVYPEITNEALGLLKVYRTSAAEENRSIRQKEDEN